MISKKRNINFKKSGFTIVELLVVIVVIAILAALVAASYAGMNRKATIASLQSDLKNSSIKLAIDKTNDDNYPATKEAADGGNGLKASPNNTYEYTSDGNTYCLSATSGALAYYVSSENGVPTSGVCPGHLLPIGYDGGSEGGGGGSEGGGEIITSGWKKISSSTGNHTCGIYYNNQVYCWGYGQYGELGANQEEATYLVPTAVLQGAMSSLEVKDISVGSYHTCVIGFDDHAYCWGRTYNGEIGDGIAGGYINRLIPTAVLQGEMPDLHVKSIVAGDNRTCAINFNDHLYCWGSNSTYLLGDGTQYDRSTPTAVLQGEMPNLNVKSVAISFRKTCAISSNNQVYCWGYYLDSPKAIAQGEMPSLSVKSISAGGNHACVIASLNSQAYCWGRNGYGELGNGNTNYVPDMDGNEPSTPVALTQGTMPNLSIKEISATGYWHTCAISSDDHVYCWGYNSAGQFGDGSTPGGELRLSPAPILQGAMPGLNVKQLTTGYNHTCAISSNNKTYCWGSGRRVGDNTAEYRFLPTSVVDPF